MCGLNTVPPRMALSFLQLLNHGVFFVWLGLEGRILEECVGTGGLLLLLREPLQFSRHKVCGCRAISRLPVFEEEVLIIPRDRD